MSSRKSCRDASSSARTFAPNISRRSMLAGAATFGAGVVLPQWLTGCTLLPTGEIEGQSATRERRTLHFDFSHLASGNYKINVVRSASHRARLTPHTAQTRARFRRQNSLLRQVADEQLTHFIEDVDFPADALQHYWITTKGADGIDSVVTSHLHVPSSAYRSLVRSKQRRAAASGRDVEPLNAAIHPKLQHLKIRDAGQQLTPTTLSDLNSINTPVDAAIAVVFHHPEIMNLDPTQAAKVLDVIDSLEGTATSCTGANVGLILALACAIAAQGPATTSGGWMKRVPAVDSQGAAVLDSNGNQVYGNEISNQTANAAQPVIQEILNRIFNDPDIKGNRAAANPGVTSIGADGSTSGASATAKVRGRAQSSNFQVSLAHPAGSIGSNLHGLLFRDFSATLGSDDSRNVSVEVENIYLRFCDAYVQYLQADKKTPILGTDGNPMKPEHLAIIPTDDAIMGIPLLDQGTLRKTTLNFAIPTAASHANILFGTLGVGSPSVGDRDQFSKDDLIHAPMAWTLVMNIGIPTFLLALGVGLQASGALKSITEDPEILLAVVAVLAPVFIAAEATRGTLEGSARGPIIDTAKLMISLCIKSIPKLSAKLLGYATSQELIDAVPFVGWACRALGIIGGVAQLAQTLGEVLSSPPVFDNTVSFAMDTTITVNRDPRDFEFPATARTWIVRATYDGTVVRETCGSLPTTRSDPITVSFTGVPLGGKVQIDVWFLSDDNWIVGQGGTGSWVATGETDETGAPVERWTPQPLDNFPETSGAVDITIREQLVPLTATTVYSHKEKIAYSGGAHQWTASSAPVQTLANVDSTRNNALHALGMITVNQAAGAVGYTWRTGTPAINTCAGENGSATSLQLVQNLSLTQRPDDAIKLPACGHIDKPAIAYSLMAHFNDAKAHVFVDPVYSPISDGTQTIASYRYFVRPVTLDSLTDKTPFATAANQAWGWFTLPSDGLAVHPLGHVISVNTANSKMEILHLPGTPSSDDTAAAATMLSGRGSQPGLLLAPVAVSISPNGAVMVLDAGNNRVQAFDTFGSVNNVFRDSDGNPVNYFPLTATDATRYLDLAVEAAVGYFFVLYFTNDGSLPEHYVLDIYTKDGVHLTKTRGLAAARLALDYWRNVYTLNFEPITGVNGRLEPSVSQWIPSTPPGNDPNALAALAACSQ